jgi:hypothetical protein
MAAKLALVVCALPVALLRCGSSAPPDAVPDAALSREPPAGSSSSGVMNNTGTSSGGAPITGVGDDAGASADATMDPAAISPGPLVGCASSRPGIAYYGGTRDAGVQALTPQPAGAPIPCVSSTGDTAIDTSMVVTSAGKLLVAPADIPGFVTSGDNGATWLGPQYPPSAPDASAPAGADAGARGVLLHPWLWRDAPSGRIFYNVFDILTGACVSGGGSHLWYSDDDGASWTHEAVGCGSQDWGKVMSGPAATAASKAALKTAGFPDVVYFCAGGPVVILGPDRWCYRSVDGGKTFTRTATDPTGSGAYPNEGTVTPDGTVFIVHGATASGVLSVSVSTDDGDSWSETPIPGTQLAGLAAGKSFDYLSSHIRSDSAGNLYVTWVDDRDYRPYLTASKDRGATWSAPIMLGAPDVQVASYTDVGVKAPGYVAVSYYGSATLQSQGGDGYFTSDGRSTTRTSLSPPTSSPARLSSGSRKSTTRAPRSSRA